MYDEDETFEAKKKGSQLRNTLNNRSSADTEQEQIRVYSDHSAKSESCTLRSSDNKKAYQRPEELLRLSRSGCAV